MAQVGSFKGVKVHSARQSSINGNRVAKVNRGASAAVVVMAKKDLHPEYFDDVVVTCNGEEVLTTSGTRQSYNVDIWSGNHPYYQGATSTIVTDEGSVNRFKRRYQGLDSLATVETLSGQQEAAATAKAAAAADKK